MHGGKQLLVLAAGSALWSIKSRKLYALTSTWPSNRNRYMDFRIGVAFDKLSTRIADDLKKTSGEFTHKLQEGTCLLSISLAQFKFWCERTSAKSI